MASALSDVEFNRMQTQLLDLRDANYQLDDRCKRQERELFALREQLVNTDRELQRSIQLNRSNFQHRLLLSSKIVNRSKKAKEFDQLLKDNDLIEKKLLSQEEEFRLQNETLMRELAQLVAANETLEKENDELKSSGVASSTLDEATQSLHDNIRRLQAQNSALQHSLSSLQDSHMSEVNRLKHIIVDLNSSANKTTTMPASASSGEGVVNGRSAEADSNCLASADEPDAVTAVTSNKATELSAAGEGYSRQISDLQLNLDTEKEENRLLRGQLQAAEAKSKSDVASLRDEVEKLSEKLKKKQESLLQLQDDKERLMQELKDKLEEAQLNKENELATLRSQLASLEQQLAQAQKATNDVQEQYRQRLAELQSHISSLEQNAGSAQVDSDRQIAELMNQTQELADKMELREHELASVIEDLRTQLQTSHSAHTGTSEQLLAVRLNLDAQILAVQEANRVAEKRKSLLDELAIKYQQESNEHREQVKALTKQYTSQVDELNVRVEQLQVKCASHDRDKEQLQQQAAQIHSLETAKSWLDKRLKETEENLQQSKEQHERTLETVKSEHEQDLTQLTSEKDEEIARLSKEIEEFQKVRGELSEAIDKLKQEIKDGVDDKKLHERKGVTVLKDLKRQLQSERKRADKLQEKLQELLADSIKGRQSVEELFRPGDMNERSKDRENSSVCSWSPSSISRDILAQTPEEDSAYLDLRQENDELLRRIGEVQQQCWMLEEKVSHLEASNGAMAEDLLTKTSIIEHYAMETKSDRVATSPLTEKLTLKRVVDFVKDKGDENLKDINRKLQRVLEETLTKNMHLQRDMEKLTLELSRLRNADSAQPPSASSSHAAST